MDCDPITGENADVMHPDFARNAGKDHSSVGEFHLEHGVGKAFQHRRLDFNAIFFAQMDFLLSSSLGDNVRIS